MTYLDIEDEYGDLSFSRQRYEEYLLDEFSFDNESLSNLVETLEKFQVEFLNKKNYFEVITPLEENCMSLKTSADIELIEKQSDVSKSNKKKFPCTYQDCAKSYSAEKVLQTHIKTHTGIKLYKCDYLTCEKVYKSKENLNLHVKNKHLGVKPYKCSYCESHFTHRNGKTYHERRMHSYFLPYKCEIGHCDKSYASKSSLNYHLKNNHKV